jgi:EAL and modified HD-GYP domain-containing signal transduction protein
MSALIVAIPLFDGEMTVKAYQLRDHNADIALDVRDDFRGRSQVYYLPGLELIQQLGLEPFSGDLPLFVDTNRFHILTGMHINKRIPADKLILSIPGKIDIDAKLLAGLVEMKSLNYRLALDSYPENGANSPLIDFAEHMILSYRDKRFLEQLDEIRKMKDKQIIISDIPNMEVYLKYSRSVKALFTGGFYEYPVTETTEELSPLKVNALELLRNINDEDFELSNIAKTIERDPSLSISLLRFINSPAVGLKSKVSSISNAVALLGQKEVKRWAMVAISVGISKDRPSEITKLSLVRAKFAENLATLFEMGIFQNSLFMTGLFSLLDLILKKPMADAVNEIAVDNLVKEALVNRSGSLHKVMDFIYAYEKADWTKVSIILIQNNIVGDLVGQAYVDALTWFHQLLASIDETEDGA